MVVGVGEPKTEKTAPTSSPGSEAETRHSIEGLLRPQRGSFFPSLSLEKPWGSIQSVCPRGRGSPGVTAPPEPRGGEAGAQAASAGTRVGHTTGTGTVPSRLPEGDGGRSASVCHGRAPGTGVLANTLHDRPLKVRLTRSCCLFLRASAQHSQLPRFFLALPGARSPSHP